MPSSTLCETMFLRSAHRPPITPDDLDRGIEIILGALDDAVSGRVPAEVLDRFAGW